MAKEFRLTVTLALPEDKFAEAKLVGELEGPLTKFIEALPKGAVLEHDIVTPRAKKAEPPVMLHQGQPGYGEAAG